MQTDEKRTTRPPNPKTWKPTSAEYPLVVTALGEVLQNDAEIAGSVDLSQLDRELGRPHTQSDVDAWFVKTVEAAVPEHLAFVQRVWQMQSVNNSRFRIYGGVFSDGPLVKLVTEFAGWVDDEAFWALLYRTAMRLGGCVVRLCTTDHLDKMKPFGASRWTYGPNHGRPELQVEIAWDVTGMDDDALAALVAKASEGTQSLWEAAGVGVL